LIGKTERESQRKAGENLKIGPCGNWQLDPCFGGVQHGGQCMQGMGHPFWRGWKLRSHWQTTIQRPLRNARLIEINRRDLATANVFPFRSFSDIAIQ
jgi:hypothetical protein